MATIDNDAFELLQPLGMIVRLDESDVPKVDLAAMVFASGVAHMQEVVAGAGSLMFDMLGGGADDADAKTTLVKAAPEMVEKLGALVCKASMPGRWTQAGGFVADASIDLTVLPHDFFARVFEAWVGLTFEGDRADPWKRAIGKLVARMTGKKVEISDLFSLTSDSPDSDSTTSSTGNTQESPTPVGASDSSE